MGCLRSGVPGCHQAVSTSRRTTLLLPRGRRASLRRVSSLHSARRGTADAGKLFRSGLVHDNRRALHRHRRTWVNIDVPLSLPSWVSMNGRTFGRHAPNPRKNSSLKVAHSVFSRNSNSPGRGGALILEVLFHQSGVDAGDRQASRAWGGGARAVSGPEMECWIVMGSGNLQKNSLAIQALPRCGRFST